MRQALAQANRFATGTLLDVGCGLRPYEDLFRERVNRYIGADLPVSMDKTRADVIANALYLPFACSSLDTLLSTEVMEHLPEPGKFLAEANRTLRPEGCLILSVPFLEPLHEEPRDYFRFTPYSLKFLLEEHGFFLEAVWQRGGWWSVAIGSFLTQSLYEWANPVGVDLRRTRTWKSGVVFPITVLSQWSGYMLDKLFRSERYTLGYLVAARLVRKDWQSGYSCSGQ
jgi:SAM-dependent methyltransferase